MARGGRGNLVKLRVKKVEAKWRVKTPRGAVIKSKKYDRPFFFVPSRVDVSDLIGRRFRVSREGNAIRFELAE